jgi:hypothetical protein
VPFCLILTHLSDRLSKCLTCVYDVRLCKNCQNNWVVLYVSGGFGGGKLRLLETGWKVQIKMHACGVFFFKGKAPTYEGGWVHAFHLQHSIPWVYFLQSVFLLWGGLCICLIHVYLSKWLSCVYDMRSCKIWWNNGISCWVVKVMLTYVVCRVRAWSRWRWEGKWRETCMWGGWVHPRKGRVVLSQFPLVWQASGHLTIQTDTSFTPAPQ